MNDITVKFNNTISHIEHEEYFPLRVVYDVITSEIHHIGFYYGDEDLLELAVVKDTGILKHMQVSICHHYSTVDSCFDYANLITTDEEVIIQLPDHNECDVFNMTIYNNCIDIKISNNDATHFAKSGQLLFGLDNTDSISRIVVTEVSKTDAEYVINELSYQ